MNYKALVSIISLFISSISALSIMNFPLDMRVAPGSDMSLMLEGNSIAPGDHVRIELWDNQDDEDVNAAVIGEELKVNSDLSINFNLPSQFPKTDNAFFRIFYKCHNTVSPRFTIKPAKNCIATKTPTKPTHTPIPIIIHKPTEGIIATPIIIVHKPIEAGSGHGQAGSGIEQAESSSGNGPVVVAITSAVRPTSHKSSATIMSTSTSTSSASVAKFSAGSLAVAMAVAVAMLF